MAYGSSYPAAQDTHTVPVGTPHCSGLLAEVASMLLAVQRTIGVDVGDLFGLGIPTITTWNAALKRRCQVEVYTFTSSATPGAETTVNYQHVGKFPSAPHVFLFEKSFGIPASRITVEGSSYFKVRCPYSTATVVTYMAVLWDE